MKMSLGEGKEAEDYSSAAVNAAATRYALCPMPACGRQALCDY